MDLKKGHTTHAPVLLTLSHPRASGPRTKSSTLSYSIVPPEPGPVYVRVLRSHDGNRKTDLPALKRPRRSGVGIRMSEVVAALRGAPKPFRSG